MANVENNEESQPNPYNMNKSWHTEEVMPEANVESANSLFVPKRSVPKETEEIEQKEVAPKDELYKKPDYKKRYDDLKRHYDTKLNEFRIREQELANKVQQVQPVYEAPKSIEELEQFKNEYPDVYEVVESVAHLQSESKMQSLSDNIEMLEAREQEVMRKEAEKDIRERHPDYEDLRNSDEFHSWAETQPEQIQDWIYNNPTNASLAVKAIDLYKLESGTDFNVQQTKRDSKKQAKASELISTKTTSVEPKEPKIWTQEEIANLSMDEFDRLESEIDRAIEEGRVRG